MKVKLMPVSSHTMALDSPTVAAMEVGFIEVVERIQVHKSQSLPLEFVKFVEGELHGLKLAAHALGYKFEEEIS